MSDIAKELEEVLKKECSACGLNKDIQNFSGVNCPECRTIASITIHHYDESLGIGCHGMCNSCGYIEEIPGITKHYKNAVTIEHEYDYWYNRWRLPYMRRSR